eukprot:CAMPEP_0197908442 /NCGR_PEP_ID=MMETSP1439-20131203/66834_1 /TAXON_ID=66791 /ORGANISM="Gonyaulax spinifera, Strain CCMP409" /LENGTH=132 /DNA_ID=CAMNT_0043529935 /DNA_START=779 /DNA_END=1175 /DNA_ORIENTATION=-
MASEFLFLIVLPPTRGARNAGVIPDATNLQVPARCVQAGGDVAKLLSTLGPVLFAAELALSRTGPVAGLPVASQSPAASTGAAGYAKWSNAVRIAPVRSARRRRPILQCPANRPDETLDNRKGGALEPVAQR